VISTTGRFGIDGGPGSQKARNSAQRYGLPLRKRSNPAHAEAEDRKLRKELAFGGPCFEGTLQKPTGVSESSPVAGAIEGSNPSTSLDAGRARELQKSAQPATQMLSVNCLYQMNAKKRKGGFEKKGSLLV
jgi:hypothetical protein